MRGEFQDVCGVAFGVCLSLFSLLVYAVLCAIASLLAGII